MGSHSHFEKESSFHVTRSTLWTDSQVVLDWLSTIKKQTVLVANHLKEILASADAYQRKHVITKENPADLGTCDLNPEEIPAKWLTAPAVLSTRQLSAPENSSQHVLATHEISRNLSEQIIDPTRFSIWNKLLLTLATVFNLVFGIKKQRPKDQQYITEDVFLARNRLIKVSQQNFFFSIIQALKRGSRIDSKCKIRSLNPMLDNNGILRSSGRLQFAPDILEVEKFLIILHAKDKIARLYIEHAHNICVHQGTEPVKVFLQQRYHIIGLRKTPLSIKYRCFLCRRFAAQNIQRVMAPLPACRFSTDSTQCPFANNGVNFFGPFYIEDAKG